MKEIFVLSIKDRTVKIISPYIYIYDGIIKKLSNVFFFLISFVTFVFKGIRRTFLLLRLKVKKVEVYFHCKCLHDVISECCLRVAFDYFI